MRERKMVNIQPIQPNLQLNILDAGQIAEIQEATLECQHRNGERFPRFDICHCQVVSDFVLRISNFAKLGAVPERSERLEL